MFNKKLLLSLSNPSSLRPLFGWDMTVRLPDFKYSLTLAKSFIIVALLT